MPDKMRKVLHAFAALADLGEEIADTADFDEMVNTALHVVLGAVGCRRGAVAEYDERASRLRVVAARGLGDSLPAYFELSTDEAVREHASGNGKGGGRAEDLVELVEHQVGRQSAAFGIDLVAPLAVRRELVGAVLVGGKASEGPFTAEDRDVIRALGRHIGVGLHNHRLLREVEERAVENRRLYEDLRTIYNDTVRAFAAAIDCKDKYTQGHSERVGRYSEVIAREMGWSSEEVEGIAVAGYLHDIGKLVVDRDIINAPYHIDAKNSSELNRHPGAGYEILKPISHPYADIPKMAFYHHERIDGRGYPHGLKGDEIPPGAKIVALADSFDAMTTDRPYRRRRVMEEVVEDLRRNAGKQFAPEVVVAFCRALLKEVNGEVNPRVIIPTLGRDYVDPVRIGPLLSELITELESSTHATAAQV